MREIESLLQQKLQLQSLMMQTVSERSKSTYCLPRLTHRMNNVLNSEVCLLLLPLLTAVQLSYVCIGGFSSKFAAEPEARSPVAVRSCTTTGQTVARPARSFLNRKAITKRTSPVSPFLPFPSKRKFAWALNSVLQSLNRYEKLYFTRIYFIKNFINFYLQKIEYYLLQIFTSVFVFY